MMRPTIVGFLTFAAATNVLAVRPQRVQKLPRIEVVVLVDLSDRIDAKLHPGQANRDSAILHIISDEFGNVVKRHRFLFSHDRLRVIYVGGENLPAEPRVDVTQMNSERRVVVREIKGELNRFRLEAARPLFVQRQRYIGADLWSWFRFNAPKQLLIEDPDYVTQRRVIILTDGYLQFAPTVHREPGTAMRMDLLRRRSDWEATYARNRLKPPGFSLPSTKVLLLEVAPIRPESNTTEQEILERYWRDWFKSMKVQSDMLTNSEALPSVRDAVKEFLNAR
jgi:hypothetical protein